MVGRGVTGMRKAALAAITLLVAAAAALAVGLGVLKRVVAARDQTAPEMRPISALRVRQESAPVLNDKAHSTAPVRRRRDRSPNRTARAPVDGDAAESEFMSE